MGLGLFDIVFLLLSRTPIGPIRRALKAAEEDGLPLTATDLQVHSLGGGDPEALVRVARQAHQEGIALSIETITEICLMSKEPLALLRAPTAIPLAERPTPLLRDQAPHDPVVAVAYVARLITDFNRLPAVIAASPNTPPGKGPRSARERTLVRRIRVQMAGEITKAMRLVPAEHRAALPALAEDV